jgi:hypothetical protein
VRLVELRLPNVRVSHGNPFAGYVGDEAIGSLRPDAVFHHDLCRPVRPQSPLPAIQPHALNKTAPPGEKRKAER